MNELTPATNNALDALSREDGAAVALAVSQAASDNTRRAYRQQWAAFTTWASAQGYPSLPAADATLAAYLTLLAGQGFALASVRQARGAVVKAHELAGFPTPAGPVTAAALLGIGRSIGAAQGQAAPLTAEGLAAIRATAHLPRRGRGGCPETAAFARRRRLVDVAIASVIRDGLLRVSETAALAWANVAPAPDGSGVATVRRSKTDPESQGQAVYLGEAAMTALAAIRPPTWTGPRPSSACRSVSCRGGFRQWPGPPVWARASAATAAGWAWPRTWRPRGWSCPS